MNLADSDLALRSGRSIALYRGNDLQPNVAAWRLRWEEECNRTQPHRG